MRFPLIHTHWYPKCSLTIPCWWQIKIWSWSFTTHRFLIILLTEMSSDTPDKEYLDKVHKLATGWYKYINHSEDMFDISEMLEKSNWEGADMYIQRRKFGRALAINTNKRGNFDFDYTKTSFSKKLSSGAIEWTVRAKITNHQTAETLPDSQMNEKRKPR